MLKIYNKYLLKYKVYNDLIYNNEIILLCNLNDIDLYKIYRQKESFLIKKTFLLKNFLLKELSGGFVYFLINLKNLNFLKNFEDLNISYLFFNKYNYILKNKENILNICNKNYLIMFLLKCSLSIKKIINKNLLFFLYFLLKNLKKFN